MFTDVIIFQHFAEVIHGCLRELMKIAFIMILLLLCIFIGGVRAIIPINAGLFSTSLHGNT